MTSFINTILRADCVKAMRTLPAASVNFVLTDPPYTEINETATKARSIPTACIRVTRSRRTSAASSTVAAG